MAKGKLRDKIEGIASKQILITFLVFVLASVIVVGLTLVKYGYHEDFIKNIVVEAHGMLFDILVIGIFIFALQKLGEKRIERKRNIQRWLEEIEDFREWDEKKAMYRIVGNIRRLNKQGVTDINISRCYLVGAGLVGNDLSGANFRGADLRNAYLTESILRNADLSGADLGGAKLCETDLRGAKLCRADLREADLHRADLRGAEFESVILSNADLYGANFKETDLRKIDLKEADLREADFRGAILSNADLSGANLTGTDLSGAKLLGANLSRANFWGTNLKEAILRKANLREADLSKVNNLTLYQLTYVNILYMTKLDSELLKQIEEKHPYLLERPEPQQKEKN